MGLTTSGHKPLIAKKNDKGKEIVSVPQMCEILYGVITEKLETSLPKCGFRDQIQVEYNVNN